jgi:hypothetical protein
MKIRADIRIYVLNWEMLMIEKSVIVLVLMGCFPHCKEVKLWFMVNQRDNVILALVVCKG